MAAITEEFTEQGFSKKPRPYLSPVLLAEAQEAHLKEVMESIHTNPVIHLVAPQENLRAYIEPEDAIGEGAEPKLEQWLPIPIKEELLWHIKETVAERTIRETQRALRDYVQRRLALWRGIRSELEQRCHLKVKAYHSTPSQMDLDPYISHELVDLTYGDVFNDTPSYQLDPDNWRPNPDQPHILMAGNWAAAVGEPCHEAVRQGVRSFLKDRFDEYHHRANELKRLHHDLQYVAAIVKEAFEQTTEEEVHQGICPACPYPETRRKPGSGTRQKDTQ
ncbi:MAG: hypothetical protein V3U95_09380 [Dehalococcoidia bacterium]